MFRMLILIVIVLGSFFTKANNLSLDLDFGTFKYKNDKVIWELYYSFPDTILTYVESDGFYKGELEVDFIASQGEKEVLVDRFSVPTQYNENPTKHKNIVYGLRAYQMEIGEYLCKFIIRDKYSNDTARINFSAKIKGFDKRNIDISDIQIAKLIEHKDSTNVNYNKMFLKNKYFVIPNPSYIVDREPYELRLYYEIYNAKKFSPEGINIKYTVYDGAKREVFSIPVKQKSYSDYIIKTINQPLSMLATGTYFVDVEISYPPDDPVVTVTRKTKFFLINKYVKPKLVTRFTESASFEKSQFSGMDAEQLDIEFRQIKYIARREEIKSYEMLNSERAKQRFLFKFWKERDIDTNDFVNTARRDFIKAIDFANLHFSYGLQKEGWDTDRGRILLKYGFPTQREMYVSDGELYAYEEWFYNDVEGGSKFVFVDKQGFNDFIMVHSDAFGEVKDYNWYDNHVKKNNSQYEKNSDQEYQERRNEFY